MPVIQPGQDISQLFIPARYFETGQPPSLEQAALEEAFRLGRAVASKTLYEYDLSLEDAHRRLHRLTRSYGDEVRYAWRAGERSVFTD